MKIYQVLEELRNPKKRYSSDMGICTNAWNRFDHYNLYGSSQKVEHAMTLWPEFNGNESFPISDPTGKHDPEMAYSMYKLWGTSKYAGKRRELLEFLITYFKERDI